jgi:hypothetical protein
VQLEADHYVHSDVYRDCREQVRARVARAAGERLLSVAAGDLLKDCNWPASLWERIKDDLTREGLFRAEGNRLVLVLGGDAFTPAEHNAMQRVQAIYRQTGFQSPRPDQIPELTGLSPEIANRAMEHLANTGQLVRLSSSVVLSREHFRQAQDLVVKTIREQGALDSADFKVMINSTRKYALAFLDFLDLRRVTIRVENRRTLTPHYERNLL